MLNMMNMMAGAVRHRMMPRRKSGMGTMTALFVGASVGIAAWEAVRKSQSGMRQSGSATSSHDSPVGIAEEVMREIQES